MRGNLLLPLLVIYAEKFSDAFVINIELRKIEIVRAWQPAYGRFNRATASFAAIDDPFEDAHIFTETRPQEFSVRAPAEPVDVKNEGGTSEAFSHVEPVLEIVADVVSAEWQHRHRIAAHSSDRAGRGGRCFRSHRRAEVNTVSPIERLINE